MAGKKGQRKRFWSDEEKRSICRQTLASGVSVAQVARRYSMNSNLIFTWLRDPRFAESAGDVSDGWEGDNLFLPIEVTRPGVAAHSMAGHVDAVQPSDVPVLAQRVDITLSDGRRIVVEGPTVLSAVMVLVQGLMA